MIEAVKAIILFPFLIICPFSPTNMHPIAENLLLVVGNLLFVQSMN